MVRVTGHLVPANLKEALGTSLIFRDYGTDRADNVALNGVLFKTPKGKYYKPGPLDFDGWTQQQNIADRIFPTTYWTRVLPYDDLIAVSIPGVVRDPNRADDPLDPLEIKPTWATYRTVSASRPYAEAGITPGFPRIGWETTLNAENWISDAYLANRVFHVLVPTTQARRYWYPWIGHITGTITAEASHRGAVTWFALALKAQWGQDADFGFPSAKTNPGAHEALIPRTLALPEDATPWTATIDVDVVVRMEIMSTKRPNDSWRYGRITLGVLPSFGRYTARNTWARVTADLSMAMYFI